MVISLQSEGYKIKINSLGAELKSYCDPSGKEFIWNSDPAFWNRSSPILFPSIGNVRNNKTIINGKEYTMPKHGLCRDMEFTLVASGKNYAEFLVKSNEETKKFYPYDFELYLSYELHGNKLKMAYKVCNKSEETMYFHLGAHPAFMCPMEAGETLNDYALKFDQKENMSSIVYDIQNLCFSSKKTYIRLDESQLLPLSAEMFDNDALYCRHTKSRGISLINTKTNKGIHLAYYDFPSIAIWTPIGGKAPFICLEPWNGSAIFDDEDDVFSHKRDIQVLNPDEIATYRMDISLLGY